MYKMTMGRARKMNTEQEHDEENDMIPSVLKNISSLKSDQPFKMIQCRCSVGWPVGERLGIGLEEMVMAEENRPPICSFLLQNHFLYPNFEMFFNYLPLTNEQMETKREDVRLEK
jgi:hypothetical protein